MCYSIFSIQFAIDEEIMPNSSELKLIRLNSCNVNLPDDPSFPFRLEAVFSPPEFLIVAFICMHGGSEDLVVRAMTKEAMEEFIATEHLRQHPRLRRLTVTGPDGVLEEITQL